MLQLIKYIALIRKNPDLKALRRWFTRNSNNFSSTAYKAFNRLINCKVGTGGIELPISKPNILSKVCNLIKSRLGYRIVVLPGLYVSEVAIKLLKPIFVTARTIEQMSH